jgi:hypothetical protein
MFPSPSDGPPWLSPSASPAFGPWGIPLELPLEDPPLEDPPLDDCVLVEDDEPEPLEEPEELEPQAATASAAKTSSNAVQRRGDLIVMGCIIVLL